MSPMRSKLPLLLPLGMLAAAACAYALVPRYSFHRRVVLVTGGSRGLGLVMARQLVDEGARVVVCARDGQELARAEDDLGRRGGQVRAIVCDVSDRERARAMVDEIEDAWGSVEVLVNNAGVIRVGPEATMTRADFEQALGVHLWAPLHLVERVLPGMRARGGGRIVNIASIGGLVPVPHLMAYCASKFALVGFSQTLCAELAREGIAVTTVCPGLMRTGSHVQAEFKGRHRAEFTWFSLGAGAPLASMSAERAAGRVLRACREGRAHVTLSVPAKAAAVAHAIAPNLFVRAMGVVNRLLPRAGGIDRRAVKGRNSASALSPSVLTVLADRASVRNHELP